MPPVRICIYILAVLAALLGLQRPRFEQEQNNQTVEMVVDLSSITDFSKASGRKISDVLKEYSSYGVTGVVLSEQKWDDLESHGEAALFNGTQLAAMWPDVDLRQHLDYSHSYVVVFQPELADEIKKQLTLGLTNVTVTRWPESNLTGALPGQLKSDSRVVFEVDLPPRAMQNFGLGFFTSPKQKELLKNFDLWVRPENRPKADAATTLEVLNQGLKLPRVQGVIFGGLANEAPGYPDALNTTIEFLKEKNLKLGFIELPKPVQQKGIEGIVRAVPELTVRVFAVPPQQQGTLRPERLAQMYGLAARERNARVLYIRPYAYDPSPDKGFENPNVTCMNILQDDLQRHVAVGAPSLFNNPVSVPIPLAMVVATGAMMVAWMLVEIFFPIPRWLGLSATVAIVVLTGIAGLTPYSQLWRTLLAFGCAGVISLYAVVHVYDDMDLVARRPKLVEVWYGSTGLWLRMTVWSLSGALLASSLLQETTFKLGLDTFRGVKALTVGVPCLAVVAWFARRGNWQAFFAVFKTPIKLYHLIGFAALALVGIFYAIRSGNVGGEAGGDALEYEKYLRMILDQTLGVRPRFKEFLIAHPAMLLAPFALRLGGPYLAWVFILAGATGQVGLADTFAHIHTPLKVSFIRCVLGAGIGWLVALCFSTVFVKVTRRLLGPLRSLQNTPAALPSGRVRRGSGSQKKGASGNFAAVPPNSTPSGVQNPPVMAASVPPSGEMASVEPV